MRVKVTRAGRMLSLGIDERTIPPPHPFAGACLLPQRLGMVRPSSGDDGRGVKMVPAREGWGEFRGLHECGGGCMRVKGMRAIPLEINEWGRRYPHLFASSRTALDVDTVIGGWCDGPRGMMGGDSRRDLHANGEVDVYALKKVDVCAEKGARVVPLESMNRTTIPIFEYRLLDLNVDKWPLVYQQFRMSIVAKREAGIQDGQWMYAPVPMEIDGLAHLFAPSRTTSQRTQVALGLPVIGGGATIFAERRAVYNIQDIQYGAYTNYEVDVCTLRKLILTDDLFRTCETYSQAGLKGNCLQAHHLYCGNVILPTLSAS
ncbi:hypothetical protein C8R44DRAFT_724124 [Mycena epipterygia]|nr:hypothetical protein C8R44DRAFT_724124 [Mycena epipterygia]